MYDMNQVSLIGRMTKDIEIRQTQNGKSLGKFTIALSDGKEKSYFFDCVCFEKTADVLSKYAGKGKQIAVSGKLQQEKWQDKTSGQNRTKVSIIANSVQLLGGKTDGGSQQTTPPPQNGFNQNGGAQQPRSPYDFSNQPPVDPNDDMPF